MSKMIYLLSIILTIQAVAEESESELIKQAKGFYDNGRMMDALDRLEKAWKLNESPNNATRLLLAYYEAGRLKDCIDASRKWQNSFEARLGKMNENESKESVKYYAEVMTGILSRLSTPVRSYGQTASGTISYGGKLYNVEAYRSNGIVTLKVDNAETRIPEEEWNAIVGSFGRAKLLDALDLKNENLSEERAENILNAKTNTTIVNGINAEWTSIGEQTASLFDWKPRVVTSETLDIEARYVMALALGAPDAPVVQNIIKLFKESHGQFDREQLLKLVRPSIRQFQFEEKFPKIGTDTQKLTQDKVRRWLSVPATPMK